MPLLALAGEAEALLVLAAHPRARNKFGRHIYCNHTVTKLYQCLDNQQKTPFNLIDYTPREA